MNLIDLLMGKGVQQSVSQTMAPGPAMQGGNPAGAALSALRASPQVFQRNPAAFSQMVGQGNPDLQARLQALARLQGVPGGAGAEGVPMALQRELAAGMQGPQLNQLPGQMEQAQLLMQMIQAGVTPQDLLTLLGGTPQPPFAVGPAPQMPRPGVQNMRDLQMMRGGGYSGE